MTALVNYIRDQRSAEKMKELLENAVKERTQEIPVAAINEAANEASAPKTETAEPTAEAVEEKTESAEKTEETPVVEEAEEKADEQPASEEPKPRFCDQCGARITSPNAKFCAECGNKLS